MFVLTPKSNTKRSNHQRYTTLHIAIIGRYSTERFDFRTRNFAMSRCESSGNQRYQIPLSCPMHRIFLPFHFHVQLALWPMSAPLYLLFVANFLACFVNLHQFNVNDRPIYCCRPLDSVSNALQYVKSYQSTALHIANFTIRGLDGALHIARTMISFYRWRLQHVTIDQ